MQREYEYDALPAELERALEATLSRPGDPEPLLADVGPGPGRPLACAAAALAGAAALVGLARLSFGELPGGIQPAWWLAIYFPASLLACWGGGAAMRWARLERRVPYVRGRFLLERAFVDTRFERLRAIPAGALHAVDGVHHHTNGAYTHTDLSLRFDGGAVEEFSVGDRARAEALLARFEEDRERMAEPHEAGFMEVVSEIEAFWLDDPDDDPPSHNRSIWRLAPADRWSGRAVTLAVAALLAAPMALTVWAARNAASDLAMYRAVEDSESIAELRAYLAEGLRHRDEVRRRLEPLAAFERARRSGSVAEMRDFRREYPGSIREAEARRSIHARYKRALENFRQQKRPGDSGFARQIEHLVADLEVAEEPIVEVRFRTPPPRMLTAFDAALAERLDAKVAPLAPHFVSERAEARREAITELLRRMLRVVFSEDLVIVRRGPSPGPAPIGQSADLFEDLPADLEHPTVFVDYGVVPSERLYTAEDGERHYVGIEVIAGLTLRVPDASERPSVAVRIEPPETLAVGPGDLELGDLSPGRSMLEPLVDAPTSSEVYDTMVERALGRILLRLRDEIFAEGSEAYRALSPPR